VANEMLFPPTRDESADWLVEFVKRERGKRVAMLQRHPGDREYWQGQVAACDAALQYIDNLRGDA
jgi:hypothetical protein